MNNRLFDLVVLVFFGLTGCQSDREPSVSSHLNVPFSGKPYDIQVVDLNHDGFDDLVITDHGKNRAEIFIQKSSGGFVSLDYAPPVGFHPGHFYFDSETSRLIEAAEGDSRIKVFSLLDTNEFNLESEFSEPSPVYISRFKWTGWDNAWVISPFHQNHVVLLKGFDPLTGKVEGRHEIPFSERRPSVVEPTRPEISDLDRDGSDELIYVARISKQLIVLGAPKVVGGEPRREVILENNGWGMPWEVTAADITGDGFPDLLMADETQPGMIRLLINDGTGKMVEGLPLDPRESEGVSKVASALDSDGTRLVVATKFDGIYLYKLGPDWKLGDVAPSIHLAWKRNHADVLVLKDINNDGWLDLVTSFQNGVNAIWVAYGPLWTNFEKLGPGFEFKASDQQKVTN